MSVRRLVVGGLRRLLAASAVLLIGASAVALSVGLPWWRDARDEAVALVDAHRDHRVAHPGWSFPARVWSAPAPLDLPAPRLVLEARARGYEEACPAVEPGQVCATDGTVVPRGGRFAEGVQPPGTQGWTRPSALEPVLLAHLVGPDGEIREHLPLEEAPPHLLAAIVAAEDEQFRDHPGVDVWGLGRAALANLRGGGVQQGASTLSMQVVRNLSQDRERTLERKLREMARAVAADRHLGKEGILQLYLDAPYLGQHGSFSIAGFQAAARYYWGIDARDLSLAQAATLAAILPAPGRFAPDRAPEVARERRDRLLRRMGELGFDVGDALLEPMDASPHPLPGERHPAFVAAVRAQLETLFPPETAWGAGLEVFTAMDLVAQRRTESVLADRVVTLERMVGRRGEEPLRAAGAVIDPETGLLVAAGDTGIQASTDFHRALHGRRQAGSSMKPLVYALAFAPGEDGLPRLRPDHAVPNTHRRFRDTDGWSPRNVGGRYSETACLATAMATSQNIATASLLEELGGPEPLIALAADLGFDTRAMPAEMGLALGQGEVTPLEMARFAATVVAGGLAVEGTAIQTVHDADGTVLFTHPGLGEAVLTEEQALLTRELMALVIRFGTGNSSRGAGGHPGYDGPAIGKTGTTDEERDLWFVGATPHYAASLWLGYDQPTRIGASASDFASPLWGWWMRAVHEGLPRDEFGGPRVEHRWVCTQSGRIPGEECQGIAAPYLPGERPKGVCDGSHGPEIGPPMSEHQSVWKKMEIARQEAEAAKEAEAEAEAVTEDAKARKARREVRAAEAREE